MLGRVNKNNLTRSTWAAFPPMEAAFKEPGGTSGSRDVRVS